MRPSDYGLELSITESGTAAVESLPPLAQQLGSVLRHPDGHTGWSCWPADA